MAVGSGGGGVEGAWVGAPGGGGGVVVSGGVGVVSGAGTEAAGRTSQLRRLRDHGERGVERQLQAH